MHATLAPLALTSSEILRYAAAFFFVVVALAIAYALVKAATTLGRVDKVLADVDHEAVPLMQKAGVTLDAVNANLTNVDGITKDVAEITDKIDGMATMIEGVVSKPARKAAAFGAGVQTAMSSFMRRERSEGDDGPSAREAAPWEQPQTSADAHFETSQPATADDTPPSYADDSSGQTASRQEA
ncbi:MAG: hypothetical protein R2826_05310 [Thermoleophilia bacterium]